MGRRIVHVELRDDLMDATITPSRRLRIIGWLRARDIDPETLITWAAVLLFIAGFWGIVGWAIWRVTH